MKNIFRSFDEFQEELSNVINFHDMVNDTIVSMLKVTGPVYVPEEEQDDYRFSYLDLDDTYTTKAVMIDPTDPGKYCLSVTSDYDGKTRLIYLDDINNDIVIEQEIIGLVFDTFNNSHLSDKKNKYILKNVKY